MTKRKKFYLIIALQIVFLLFMVGSKVFTLVTGTTVLLEVVPVDPRDVFRGEYARLTYTVSTVEGPAAQSLKKSDIVFVRLKKEDRFWGIGSFSMERPSRQSNTQEEVTIIGKVSATSERTVYTMRGFRNVTAGSPAGQVPELVRQIKEVEWRYPRRHWKEGDTLYFPFVRDSANHWNVRTYDANTDRHAVMKRLAHEKRKHVILSAIVASVEQKYSATVAYGIESYYVQEGKARDIERMRRPGPVSVEISVDRFGNAVIRRILIDDKPFLY